MKAQPVSYRYLLTYRGAPFELVAATDATFAATLNRNFSGASRWARRMLINGKLNRAPKFARPERSGYDLHKSLTATDSSVCRSRERRLVGITIFERRLLRRHQGRSPMSGTVRFDFMHFMPYVHLAGESQGLQVALGRFPEQVLRPQEGHALYQRYLAELVLADKARLRRDRRQRASQHQLQHDGGAEPDRRRAHPADQERQDLRVGHAAESGILRTAWPRSTPCST